MRLKPHQKTRILQFIYHYKGTKELYIALVSTGLNVAHSCISRYLKDLERRGLIELFVGNHYRQRRYVKLTDKGRKVCVHLNGYFKIVKEVLG